MNFERGKDPKEAISIGMYKIAYTIKRIELNFSNKMGDTFNLVSSNPQLEDDMKETLRLLSSGFLNTGILKGKFIDIVTRFKKANDNMIGNNMIGIEVPKNNLLHNFKFNFLLFDGKSKILSLYEIYQMRDKLGGKYFKYKDEYYRVPEDLCWF